MKNKGNLQRIPYKALAEIEKSSTEITELKPTCEEIEAYGENGYYGAVTYTGSAGYHKPKIHNTWGEKRGGRVHIDMGCGGYHLMLDRSFAKDFIDFIKERRQNKRNNG
jgi:hypothetical protein